MSSYFQQEQILLNCPHTSHQKEMTNTHDHAFVDFNVWSSYPASAYEESPTMMTPVLDNGCVSPISANHSVCCTIPQPTNTSVEHYFDVEERDGSRCGSIFTTGDSMELLICNSNCIDASLTYSSSSDDMAAFLFGSIGSVHNGNGSLDQQQDRLYHLEVGAMQENYGFEMVSTAMDSDNDISLFLESEGVTNGSMNRSNSPLPSNKSIFQWPSSSSPPPAISSFPIHDQQFLDTCRSTHIVTNTANANTTAATTKKTLTSSKSSRTESSKRKRSNSERKATKKMTTNGNSQQNDDDDDDDDRNNKKRSTGKRRVSEENEKRFGCPICRRKFSRRYNLNTHIRTHNANRIKEFICDICNMGFDRKHDKNRHIASVHRGILDFDCKYCPSSFCRRDALVRHTQSAHPQYA